jgi:CheY-like chemotaxis protein
VRRPSSNARDAERPRKSILVVDDDEDMRAAIALVLSPAYRVVMAVDGLDGYVKATDRPLPNIIITDVSMPHLDGITMVRRIRENDALHRIPVIFLTGQESGASLVASRSVGAFAFLAKPTTPDQLESTVKSACAEQERGTGGNGQPRAQRPRRSPPFTSRYPGRRTRRA